MESRKESWAGRHKGLIRMFIITLVLFLIPFGLAALGLEATYFASFMGQITGILWLVYGIVKLAQLIKRKAVSQAITKEI